jgi:hypothetical protein
MEEPIKGVMKEVKVAMIKAAFFVPALFTRNSLHIVFLSKNGFLVSLPR